MWSCSHLLLLFIWVAFAGAQCPSGLSPADFKTPSGILVSPCCYKGSDGKPCCDGLGNPCHRLEESPDCCDGAAGSCYSLFNQDGVDSANFKVTKDKNVEDKRCIWDGSSPTGHGKCFAPTFENWQGALNQAAAVAHGVPPFRDVPDQNVCSSGSVSVGQTIVYLTCDPPTPDKAPCYYNQQLGSCSGGFCALSQPSPPPALVPAVPPPSPTSSGVSSGPATVVDLLGLSTTIELSGPVLAVLDFAFTDGSHSYFDVQGTRDASGNPMAVTGFASTSASPAGIAVVGGGRRLMQLGASSQLQLYSFCNGAAYTSADVVGNVQVAGVSFSGLSFQGLTSAYDPVPMPAAEGSVYQYAGTFINAPATSLLIPARAVAIQQCQTLQSVFLTYCNSQQANLDQLYLAVCAISGGLVAVKGGQVVAGTTFAVACGSVEAFRTYFCNYERTLDCTTTQVDVQLIATAVATFPSGTSTTVPLGSGSFSIGAIPAILQGTIEVDPDAGGCACPPDSQACGTACCITGQTCCGGTCCDAGQICDATGSCMERQGCGGPGDPAGLNCAPPAPSPMSNPLAACGVSGNTTSLSSDATCPPTNGCNPGDPAAFHGNTCNSFCEALFEAQPSVAPCCVLVYTCNYGPCAPAACCGFQSCIELLG